MKFIVSIAALLLLSMVMAGCGGDTTVDLTDKSAAASTAFTRRIQLMGQTSAEYSREMLYATDTMETLRQVNVTYRDGRKGSFEYGENGKLMRYVQYHKGGALAYEASYNTDGKRILLSRKLRRDGTQELTTEVGGDGTRTYTLFDKAGKEQTRTTVYADGRADQVKYSADGKTAPATTRYPASDTEVVLNRSNEYDEYGDYYDSSNGTVKLRIKARGALVREWDYYNASGVKAHSGKYRADGAIVFTHYGQDGKPIYEQTWRLLVEDWLRRYYVLDSVSQFYPGGSAVQWRWKLNDDGTRALSVEGWAAGGTQTSLTYLRRNGTRERQELFEKNAQGVVSTRVEQLPEEGAQPFLPNPAWMQHPAAGDTDSIYVLTGTPFFGTAFSSDPREDTLFQYR